MKPSNLFITFCTFFLIAFSFNVSAYNWDFSNSSDYFYNTSEIIVSGGNAYLNGTISAPIYSWWHLNENNGTQINDSSGNNYTGMALGNPTWISGKLNSALQFNGLNQYVDFGNLTANFERTQAFSVELWFKTSATSSGQIIISKIQPTGSFTGWEIFYDGTATNNIYFDEINSVTPSNMLRVYCTPAVVADNNWHHLVVTYDGSSSPSGVKFYFDGVLKTTGTGINTLTGSILTSTSLQLDGRNSGATGLVGSLDEVVIYSGVLTATKVTARYNSGNGTENAIGDYQTGNYTIQPKTNFSFAVALNLFNETAIKTGSQIKYSINGNGTWKYWNGASWVASDGSYAQSSLASDINSQISSLTNSGNLSFRAVLHSTDGLYTPYLDNIEATETPMIVDFNYQFPSDLTIYEHNVTISYNVTPNSQPLNLSSINLFYKVNSTLHNTCWVFVNGTGTRCGFMSQIYASNLTNTFLWNLDDDDIYPAIYPLSYPLLQNTTHSTSILNNNNDYIKAKVFNFSSTEVYNLIEAMITRTSGSTSSLRAYYCNSTYFIGDPSTSSNCNNFYILPDTTTYNHTEGNSSYNIFPITINITSGKIGNVVITSTSYILFRGNTGTTWTYSYIPNIARVGQTQISSGAGATWTNLSGTFDLHIHQYDGNDTLNYYTQFCDTLNRCTTTNTHQDLLQLGNQPPSIPVITYPANFFYHGNITINYTQSISPNGYAIVSYNISLRNSNGSFNQTIVSNNYPNLSYNLITTLYNDSYYKINVEACDVNGLCSTGTSDLFLLDNTPPIGILINLNDTVSNLDIQNFSVFAFDTFNLSNMTFYLYNNSNYLINQTIIETNQSTGIFSVIYNFISDGIYHWFFVIEDLASNVFQTLTNYITINTGVPIISITYPQNYLYDYTITNMNFTISGITETCWYSLDRGTTNISLLCSSNSINNILSNQGINQWSISANNSFGNTTTENVIFNVSCQNPNATLEIPYYPYIDINTTLQIKLTPFTVSSSHIKIFLMNAENNSENSTFNMTFNGIDGYILNLLFSETSNYSFVVYGDGICPTLANNITGTFLVREPFFVNVQLFEDNPSYSAIVDNRAYITAEFDTSRKIDPILENFIHPLIYNGFYAKSFHSPYQGGEATIKLYEPNVKYAYRYINGVVDFEGQYSIANITRSYGENVYLGSIVSNGTNATLQFVLNEKDLHAYRWLFNWGLIFGIIICIVGAVFLFFVIPEKPALSLIFGVGGIAMLTLLRLVVWIWSGN